MAEKKTTAAAKKPVEKKDRKKLRGALLVILGLVLITAALIFGMIWLKGALFHRNQRFALREVTVTGSGYWKTHPKELASRLELNNGINLFSFKLREIRKKILAVPNVESCTVVRILPDTLVIHVTERVPRAFINSPRSPWVLDSKAVVMPRNQVMGNPGRLPVITGVDTRRITPGKELRELRTALELIMLTVRNFRDITIYEISIRNPEKMSVLLRYGRFPLCRVLIPVKNKGLSLMLLTLQSAIINTRRAGENKNTYDLSFEGKVVIR